MNRFKDITGQVYGRLTVIRYEGTNTRKEALWLCVCDCGKSKIVATRFLNGKITRSCGCLRKEVLSNLKSGDKHHNWKGGISTKNELDRKSYSYKQWRKDCFERDNYKCKKCAEGGILNVHHIQSFTNNETLRTTFSNGITFCESCHKEFHKKYGQQNNNYSQVVSFIHGELQYVW